MSENSGFRRWGRYLVAATLAGVVIWFAFVANREVPILDLFDLGVHEAGHLLLGFGPQMVMFLAGSAAQVLLPLALAWYFGVSRGDAAGGGFCLAWAGASMWDVSVYISDAPVQALPLIGGGQHDWAFLLGPRGWDVMHRSAEIAGFVEFAGAVLAVLGLLIATWAAIRGLMRKPVPLLRPVPAPTTQDPWVAASQLPFHHDRAVGE